jgi:hypothetical protein
VGQSFGSEPVVAILEARDPAGRGTYLVCTPNRGAFRAEPAAITPHEVLAVEYFA